MNNKQQELIKKLAHVYIEIAIECDEDEKFHNILIANNDLYPLSLDEMGPEWHEVALGVRK